MSRPRLSATRRGAGLAEQLDPLIVVFGVLAGLVLVLLRDDLVPAHFQFDGVKIQSAAQGIIYGDYTFDVVGEIYRVLGMSESPLLAGLFGYAAFMIVLFAAMRVSTPSLYRSAMFGLSAVLAGVYLGGYSKDVFVLGVVYVLLVAGRSWWWDVLIALVMLWYATNFRQYWALVAVGYLTLRVSHHWMRRPRALLMAVVGGVVIMSLGLWLVLGVDPDSFRVLANESRSDVADSTVIEPFFGGFEPVSGFLNNVLTLLVLMVPVPLLIRGDLYYLVIAAMLIFVWVGFFRAIVRNKAERSTILTRRATALVLGFVAVQALFEPDYGSALRHLVPLLPLMIVVAAGGSHSAEAVARTRSSTGKQVA